MPFINGVKSVGVLSCTGTQAANKLLLLLHTLLIQAGHKHLGKKEKQLGVCKGMVGNTNCSKLKKRLCVSGGAMVNATGFLGIKVIWLYRRKLAYHSP